jgi:metaxin
LDAIVYGHLALHVVPTMANPRLFTILSFEFPSLIAFCARMKPLAHRVELERSPLQRPSLSELFKDFLSHPETYVNWMFEGFQDKVVTERTKEERVEKFWRGLSVCAALTFFVGFAIQNKAIVIARK